MSSVQVGASCYATPVDAGAAACAAHVSSVTVQGGDVVSLSCAGVTALGELVMQTGVVPVGSSASAVVSQYTLAPVFQPCQDADKVQAGLMITSAVIVAVTLCGCAYSVVRFLNWSRGEPT